MLEYILRQGHAQRHVLLEEAISLAKKFFSNYNEFMEMMVLRSKMRELDGTICKLLLAGKSAVIRVRNTGYHWFRVFWTERDTIFKDMPFSATM